MWTRRRFASATFLTVLFAALVGYSSVQNDDARLAAAALVRQAPAVEAEDVPAQPTDQPHQLSLAARLARASAADRLREIILALEPIANPEPSHPPAEIAPTGTDESLLSPEQPLAQLSPAAAVLARARPGSVSVLVRDLVAGRTYSYQPDALHVLASLTKVSIALAALEQQRVTAQFEWETQYWPREMIINSDNWATLMVLDAIGGEPVFLDYLESVGLPNLPRFYFLPDWGESVDRAADVFDLFTMLGTADGVNPLVRAAVRPTRRGRARSALGLERRAVRRTAGLERAAQERLVPRRDRLARAQRRDCARRRGSSALRHCRHDVASARFREWHGRH